MLELPYQKFIRVDTCIFYHDFLTQEAGGRELYPDDETRGGAFRVLQAEKILFVGVDHFCSKRYVNPD